MSIETTNLVTTFADGEGHTHNWTYRDVDTSLTPQEMKAACELLTTLDIFEKDGVKLFDSVVSGKLVTKKSPLFSTAQQTFRRKRILLNLTRLAFLWQRLKNLLRFLKHWFHSFLCPWSARKCQRSYLRTLRRLTNRH